MKNLAWLAIASMVFGILLLLADINGVGFAVWLVGYLYITVEIYRTSAAAARSKGNTGWIWGIFSIIKWYPLPIIWLLVMYYFRWRTKEYKDMVRERESLEGKGERPRP